MLRIPSSVAAAFAVIVLAPLVACESSSTRAAATSSSEALASGLTLTSGVALSANPAAAGQT
ncbi:MAG TPA: hypothetical protein VIY73_05365, partial [Polyangiaceae bacterium]